MSNVLNFLERDWMGFWHTGYFEFHEPTGLDDVRFEPSPPRFPCKYCDEVYDSSDELRRHRFENHTLRRPTLFLQDQELGTRPFRITRQLIVDDVRTDNCDRARVNGHEISIDAIPRELARGLSGISKVVLSNKDDVSKEFTLDFRIASEGHLKGIEEHFERMAREGRLSFYAIEEFIEAASKFDSALGYCDGICEYLYGILAMENLPGREQPPRLETRFRARGAQRPQLLTA